MITGGAYALCEILGIDTKYLQGEMTVDSSSGGLKVKVEYFLPPERVEEVVELYKGEGMELADKFVIHHSVKEKKPSGVPGTREWDVVGDTHYFINDIEVSEEEFALKAPAIIDIATYCTI